MTASDSVARHPGDVTENGIAAFDDVINHRGETGLDCDFSVTDMVLPSDAKYLALAFRMYSVNKAKN